VPAVLHGLETRDTIRRVQLARLAHHLLDFCYPGSCAACDEPCDGRSRLCEQCDAKLANLENEAFCSRCAMPLGQHDAPCPYCFGEGARPFERVLRLGTFTDPLKHLVHQIKYHHRWTLAEYLADRMLARDPVRRLLDDADCIVAVPLHPFRHMSRGYNQAELIAKRLAKRSKRKLVHPVVRLRNTETQTNLHSKQKRLENLRGAFELSRPRAIRDRHVVVVDDVMTTGATLHSIARTLLDAEPASLSAIVLAVADPRRQDFQSI